MMNEKCSGFVAAMALASCGALPAHSRVAPIARSQIESVVPQALALYAELHEHPELSNQEQRTASVIAKRMQMLGYEVHEKVGGHGVVGVLKNGPGVLVMLRTDMDALPVLEQTNIPGASVARAKDESGREVPVMHACGHDLHMAALMGTAEILANHRNLWAGTLVLVAQPAEERLSGARAMLKDGLYARFGKPTVAFAIHVHDKLPAGSVGYTYGPFAASADSVDLIVHGRGGHGAYPQDAVDPIVIAAKIVLSLQTIVSRENDPLDPVVISVGSIHGGLKHNTIPDDVKLELTVRTYHPESRRRVLAAIARIANAEAEAAGAKEKPTMVITEGTSATVSDETWTRRALEALGSVVDTGAIVAIRPEMGSEDFGEYAAGSVPTVMLQVGAVEPQKYEAFKTHGEPLAAIHSGQFLPAQPRTLQTAILVETTVALRYFQRD